MERNRQEQLDQIKQTRSRQKAIKKTRGRGGKGPQLTDRGSFDADQGSNSGIAVGRKRSSAKHQADAGSQMSEERGTSGSRKSLHLD